MSVFNNQYSDKVDRAPSMTGGTDLRVNSIDFDTSCDCQVTACDGGTIKFCAPVTFDPPLPPQPHSNGTCEEPIPLAVFTKIKFSGESECQIENCPSRGDSAIVACNEFNFTQGLIGGYAGTCDNPFEEVVTNVLKFDAGADCQIVSCDGESTITACNEFDFAVGLVGGYAGTCDNPFEEVVTNVLKFGAGADCQIVSCEEATPITICSPLVISGDLGTCDNPVPTVVTDVLKLKGGDGVTPNIDTCEPTDKIIANGSAGVNITAEDGDILLSAVGGVNSEIVSTARDAVRMSGDIQPSGGTSYPYATAFTWVQHGEIGHSGAGYWGLPDEGQRVGSQTFPNPPPPGIKLWSCNFSPQDEQLAGNGSFSHAGFSFVSAISNISGTVGVNRSWTCTSSLLPDGDDLVIGTPDPMTVNYHSAIGSLAKPITTINATTMESTIINAATVDATTVNATTVNATTVGTALVPIPTIKATDIDADTITTKNFRTSTKMNIGSGYGAAQLNQPPPDQNGSPNDKAGDIAFGVHSGPPHGLYFYCCFQDYVAPGGVQIWWSSNSFNRTF